MSQERQTPRWRAVQKSAKLPKMSSSSSENVVGNQGNPPHRRRLVDESHIVGKYAMRDIIIAMQENIVDWAKVLARMLPQYAALPSDLSEPWNDAWSLDKYQGSLGSSKDVDDTHVKWLKVRKNKPEFRQLLYHSNVFPSIGDLRHITDKSQLALLRASYACVKDGSDGHRFAFQIVPPPILSDKFVMDCILDALEVAFKKGMRAWST